MSDIAKRLRVWCNETRRGPTPLKYAIPLAQQAADALDESERQMRGWQDRCAVAELRAARAEAIMGRMLSWVPSTATDIHRDYAEYWADVAISTVKSPATAPKEGDRCSASLGGAGQCWKPKGHDGQHSLADWSNSPFDRSDR
jgi:hypothetical protein